MTIPTLGDEYDELCTFADIEYTPAWKKPVSEQEEGWKKPKEEMVFTVNSNEHTQKVVLSSRLGDFVADGRTKFTLRTPIISPMNMMSMIYLESCVLQTPT